MIIYKTTNLINNKFYIGKDARDNSNYYGSGLLLKRSIKKYGKENFIKETLEVCSTYDEMAEREIYWIRKLDARNLDIGYNLAEGGKGGCLGCKFSDEHKRKIGEALKGHVGSNPSPEARKKISEGNKGKIVTEEHRDKLRIPIKQLTKEGELIKIWGSTTEIWEVYPHCKVSECARGTRKTSHGFKWEYE